MNVWEAVRRKALEVRARIDMGRFDVDAIYPIVMQRGNYVVDMGNERSAWYDVTPVVNDDVTVTMLSGGYVIGFVREFDNIGMFTGESVQM
ncbi:hypothetical protein C3E79_10150 [Corynebacterium liangguodongii]|uniref:Uncharacterized protein n=2 Tax=Corynebacterium liangguodongii TaxID=2079535 RepID=A0A2S0WG95_9CORY|nr:hypothetical protein C3E79_10150 [Corynebacterium liangguodongii]PWB99147.1 hypothetical protein DF219_07765 [Corynebacterium liangguodongii]